MATVNKNFRVKNGLVVEGSTATVNGYDILTKSSADQTYIVDLIGGQATSANTPNTVVKRDGSGNFSAGTITATFSGNLTGNVTGNVTGTVSDISNHDTDDLAEGSNNKYFTDARAKSAAADLLTNANLTNITITGNGSGLTITAENGVADSNTDQLTEGSTNLYFTNARARSAVSAGTGLNYNSTTGVFSVSANTYDAYGAASSAESAANTFTTNAINALSTTDIEEGTNLYYTNTRARNAVSAGSGLNYNNGTGEFSVDTSVIANKSYVDGAISALVDAAPALLDTLNELAAAIGDDANFVTTVTNSIAEKVAKAGDTMTGALTLHADPTSNLHAATKQYVDNSASSAQSAAESTAQGALNDVLDGSTAFTAINVNDLAKQVAAQATLANTSEATAYSWAKASYRTAKFLVKFAYGSHTDVSEVLLTLDTSDNVAITEYAIVTTNGSLGSVSADVSGNDVRLRVTATNANTSVKVFGTLLV